MTPSYLWDTTGGPICLSPHQQHVTGGTDSITVPLLLQDPMCQVQGVHLQTIHCWQMVRGRQQQLSVSMGDAGTMAELCSFGAKRLVLTLGR